MDNQFEYKIEDFEQNMVANAYIYEVLKSML